MKRLGVLFAGVLAAAALVAAPASAATSRVNCIPESLTLVGTKDSICLASPTPSIVPPFFAVQELNGSQWTWCLYTQPKYQGAFLRVPPFSAASFAATFASGRTC